MPGKSKEENNREGHLKGLAVALALFIIVTVALVITSHFYNDSYSKRLSSLHQDLQCMECCISENSGKNCAKECGNRLHCDWRNDPNYSKDKITQTVEDVLKQGDSIPPDMKDDAKIEKMKKQLKEEILKQDTPSAHVVVANSDRNFRKKRKTQANHVKWQWRNGAGEAFNTKLSHKHAFRFNQTNGKLTIDVLQSGKYNLQMHTTFIARSSGRSPHKVTQQLFRKGNLIDPILKECREFSTKYCTLESSVVLKLAENDQLHFLYLIDQQLHWPSNVEISDKEADTFISLYMI